ncbi:hypothetical protein FBU31_001606 [Coemansia sp. 'formosensis']|nr:hypothetical protein FBU31_001606 [Coemansia sp. 'formosensis']
MDEQTAVAILARLVGAALPSRFSTEDGARARQLAQALLGPSSIEATRSQHGLAVVDWDRSALHEVATAGAVASVDAKPFEGSEVGRVTAYSANTGRLRALADVGEALQGQWTWVHVADPTVAELLELAVAVPAAGEALGEDAGGGDRMEDVDGLVVLRYGGVRAVIGGSTVVSTSYSLGAGLAGAALRRVASGAALDIAWGLVDAATDAAAQHLRGVEAEVRLIEQGGGADMLGRMGAARRAVLCAWRALQRQRTLGGARVAGLLAACAHCEVGLARAHAQYAAGAAVAQARATMRLARVSNRWLLVAAVLLPAQYAAGLFGMNVAVPWKHAKDGHYENNRAWLGILAGMCCIFMAFSVVIVSARIKRLI